MKDSVYLPVTAKEVAIILNIPDDEELSGEHIAESMLSGETRFTRAELRIIAERKGIRVDQLVLLDPAFRSYADPVSEERKRIARRIVAAGYSAEFAAEICGVAREDIEI